MSLLTNLISHWKLDEESNGSEPITRVDAHGDNDLTDNGNTPSGTGKISYGANLEVGASNYLSIADASQTGLDLGGTFTLDAWINPESLDATMTIMSKADLGNNKRSYLFNLATSGLLTLQLSDDGTSNAGHLIVHTVDAGNEISTGTLVHVAVTVDLSDESVQFYINGSPVDSTVTSGTGIGASVFNNDVPFAIGGRFNSESPTSFFDGIIDEVNIWSRELSSTEVTSLYNGGAGLAYPLAVPSSSPSSSPSVSPSGSPSLSPSKSPSSSPSTSESVSPSVSPSKSPSVSPSLSESASPSVSPSVSESVSPSLSESVSPSVSPSTSESISPSVSESASPSVSPSKSPSSSPSVSESVSPSISPSISPSLSESVSPSASPSLSESVSPSLSESVSPSMSPSTSESASPSASPSEQDWDYEAKNTATYTYKSKNSTNWTYKNKNSL